MHKTKSDLKTYCGTLKYREGPKSSSQDSNTELLGSSELSRQFCQERQHHRGLTCCILKDSLLVILCRCLAEIRAGFWPPWSFVATFAESRSASSRSKRLTKAFLPLRMERATGTNHTWGHMWNAFRANISMPQYPNISMPQYPTISGCRMLMTVDQDMPTFFPCILRRCSEWCIRNACLQRKQQIWTCPCVRKEAPASLRGRAHLFAFCLAVSDARLLLWTLSKKALWRSGFFLCCFCFNRLFFSSPGLRFTLPGADCKPWDNQVIPTVLCSDIVCHSLLSLLERAGLECWLRRLLENTAAQFAAEGIACSLSTLNWLGSK